MFFTNKKLVLFLTAQNLEILVKKKFADSEFKICDFYLMSLL